MANLGRLQTLERAIQKESETRESRFLRGLDRYRDSKFIGPQLSPTTSVIEGKHCNLRFYNSGNRKDAERRPLVLCIPSLVNKYYILDLTPQTSLVQHLNRDALDVCIVEWHTPEEQDFDMGVDGYVLSLLETLQEHWGIINRPLVTVGYCLGGVIATAFTCLFPRVLGLALLATPWDFSHYSFAKMENEQRLALRQKIDKRPLFASENVQSLCYLANAGRVIKQFSKFSESSSIRDEMHFVAMQHWANDGVDVTRAVAEQCLLDWPKDNPLPKGIWEVGGQVIRPKELNIPIFAAVPTRDNIVPYECAIPLVDGMQDVTLIKPSSGHVGMVAGLEQGESMLLPMKRWMTQF
ncbi:MAG: hypothetical protein P8P30_02405 [Rickettsiales bacterium]|nr:hypothetical protein [Rickettsiales bacterium]